MQRYRSYLLVLGTFLLAAACGPKLTKHGLCEAGTYATSRRACLSLAEGAVDDAERERLELRAARQALWACAEPKDMPGGHSCEQAVETLFERSEDPEELVTMVRIAQQRCAEHEGALCQVASRASWLGRGVAADAAASLAWYQRCGSSCGTWIGHAAETKLPDAEWLAHIDQLRAQGAHAAASVLLRSVVERGVVDPSSPAARAASEGLLAALWASKVAPQLQAGKQVAAIATARALLSGMPTGTSYHARTAELARAEVERELAQSRAAAERGATFAARFHAALAHRIDPSVRVPRADIAGLTAPLPLYPAFEVTGTCSWLGASLGRLHRPAPASGVARVSATCTGNERRWEDTEKYRYQEKVEVTKTRTVDGPETKSTSCPNVLQNQCRTYPTGTYCSNVLVKGPCTTTYSRGPSRTETYTAYEYVTKYGTRPVSKRALELVVTGTIEHAGRTRPISYRRRIEEEQGAEGRRFSSVSMRSLEREAAAAAAGTYSQIVTDLRLAAAREEIAAARTATGGALAVEEHLLRARELGDSGQVLAEAYDLSASELAVLMTSGTLALDAKGAATIVDARLAMPAQISGGYPLSHYPPRPSSQTEAERELFEGPRPSRVGIAMKKLLPGVAVSLRYGERIEDASFKSYGVGVERAYLQRRPKELTSVFGLALGKDDLGGTWFNGRLGLGAGLRGLGMHLVVGAGGELASAGVADPMMQGTPTSDLAAGLFLESELRIGLGSGFGVSGRWGRLYGGPFDEEQRLSGSLIWQGRTSAEWALFAARRAYDGGRLSELGISIRLPTDW